MFGIAFRYTCSAVRSENSEAENRKIHRALVTQTIPRRKHVLGMALILSATALVFLLQSERPFIQIGNGTAKQSVPIVFTRYGGDSVLFTVQTTVGTVSFLLDRVLFALREDEQSTGIPSAAYTISTRKYGNSRSGAKRTYHLVTLRFEGANADCRIEGLHPLASKMSVFKGSDPSAWRTGIPQYSRIRYSNVYKGIDLEFYDKDGSLKYEYIVHPEGNPESIRMAYEEIDSLCVVKGGALQIATGKYTFTDSAPLTYQQASGDVQNINANYQLASSREYGIKVGDYNKKMNLIIDPGFTIFIGGTLGDRITDIAVGQNGYIYIMGRTGSVDYPSTTDAYQKDYHSGGDMFVSVLSPAGDIIASTFIGGSGWDYGHNLSFDGDGNVIICAHTDSQDYPITQDSFQAKYGGGATDGAISKLDPLCKTLIYSTYLGGTGYDNLWSLATDSSGNMYVTGLTDSPNFPVTPGAFQTTYAGGEDDVFVTKLSSDGQRLIYSTLLGGNDWDEGYSIKVDKERNAYVCGLTRSGNYPVSANAFQTGRPGEDDGFVTKINRTGDSLLYSTYLGGSEGNDVSFSLTPDDSGGAFITGMTDSKDFPTTPGVVQDVKPHPVSTDCFISHLNGAGGSLNASTYYGAIGVRGYNEPDYISLFRNMVCITGFTAARKYPVTCSGCSDSVRGEWDGFVTIFDRDLSSVTYSALFGGDSDEQCGPVVVVDNTLIISGWSSSSGGFHDSNGMINTSKPGQTDGMLVFLNLDELLSTQGLNPGSPSIALHQNYPNPISLYQHEAVISYSLPKSSQIVLTLIDVQGKEVARLVDRYEAAGDHSVAIVTTALAQGVYYYKLQDENAVRIRKLVIVR